MNVRGGVNSLVELFVTPDELRYLADECERHWSRCAPGSRLDFWTIHVHQQAGMAPVVIKLLCRQEDMDRNKQVAS